MEIFWNLHGMYSTLNQMAWCQCYNLWQFAMPETCENWLGLVNSYIDYAHQTHKIYQVMSNSLDFKAPGEHWNPLSKMLLCKCNWNLEWGTGEHLKWPKSSKVTCMSDL